MRVKKNNLLKQFEQKQQDLYNLGEKYGHFSEEVIACSQELDKIVIQLQRLDNRLPMIEYLAAFHGNQDYFECHDILEEHWKTFIPIDKKSVYVGFIQLAVGMYHYRAGNSLGAIEMLSNSAKILKQQMEDVLYLGIDGENLNIKINGVLTNLLRKRPFTPFEIPILDETLKVQAYEVCEKMGFKWFDPAYQPDESIIFKHKLRDRTNVIETRAKNLKLKNNHLRTKTL